VPHPIQTSLQLALRAALAASLAVVIANAFGLEHPIYAMIAAVIVTDLAPAQSRRLALQRVAGTILGALAGATACPLVQGAHWAVALPVLASMFVCGALRLPEAAKLAGYLSGLIVLSHAASPWYYSLERLLETFLGIGIALLLSLVPKLLRAEGGSTSAES
jgi:uncharacterized membrane protein YgaE (UPF0421/DUF939 family)